MGRTQPEMNQLSEIELSKICGGHDEIHRPAQEDPPVCEIFCGLKQLCLEGKQSSSRVWVVQGLVPVAKFVLKFHNTMTIVREDNGDLTIFNSLRVPEPVEKQIEALGPVRNVVRIAQFHGMFDSYYCRKFGAKLWAMNGATLPPGQSIDRFLSVDGEFPVKGAKVYVLEGLPYKEAVVVIPDPIGPICITGDTWTHMTTTEKVPIPGKLILRGSLVERTGVPSPFAMWLKWAVQVCGAGNALGWYSKILSVEFDHVVTAHGPPAMSVDKEALDKATQSRVNSI